LRYYYYINSFPFQSIAIHFIIIIISIICVWRISCAVFTYAF